EEFPKSYEVSKEGWGTYAGRIFATPLVRKDGTSKSRVQVIVEKLRKNAAPGGNKMRAAYEAELLDSSTDEDLSLYCAESDSGLGRGQPCLVHLSFKLVGRMVHLTAVYRSQHFMSKGL